MVWQFRFYAAFQHFLLTKEEEEETWHIGLNDYHLRYIRGRFQVDDTIAIVPGDGYVVPVG